MNNTETFLIASVLLLACFAVRQTLRLNAAKNVLLLHAVQIKFAHQSCDTTNERLDAHWKYLETLSARLDTHKSMIESTDERVNKWMDTTLTALETLKDVLPQDNE